MTTTKREFRGKSARARQLLNRDEGVDVEFKEVLGAVRSEHLVAFANSQTGGVILIGVREISQKGRQRGEVVGCPVDDAARLTVVNKAENCSPPVEVEIYIEDAATTPFMRVEVASGNRKPYATLGGAYKTRLDGRVAALLPGRLLDIVLEREAKKFLQRFRSATTEIQEEFGRVRRELQDRMEDMRSEVEGVAYNLRLHLEEINGVSDDSLSIAEEALTTAENAAEWAWQAHQEAENAVAWCRSIEGRVNLLLDHHGIEDPDVTRYRALEQGMIEQIHKEVKRPGKRKLIRQLAGTMNLLSYERAVELCEQEWAEFLERRRAEPSDL